MQKTTRCKPNRNSDQYEDDEYVVQQALSFGVHQKVTNTFRVALDEEFKSPDYYRNVVSILEDAGEDDVIEFYINSPGGRLDGLTSLLDGLARTAATTVARITGTAASAASIFALSCDVVEVGPYADMLCHTARHGTVGKAADVEAAAVFTSKYARKLLSQAYHNFLNPEEIELVIQGREMYLDAEEIAERLQRRQDLSIQEQEAAEQELEKELKPAKKSRK